MARDTAYRRAEQRIEEVQRSGARQIDLSGGGNKLTELPKSLWGLTQLEVLDLSDNKLTALPDSVGQLAGLKSLDVSNNFLTELPDSLGSLKQLRSLELSYNQLTVLPESLGRLTQLRILVLHDNRLTALPDSLRELRDLEALVLGDLTGGNEFREIPVQIRQLKRLEKLWISRNHLRQLPDWLAELRELRALYLYRNELTDLPASFGSLLEDFTKLDLDENPLAPELATAYKDGVRGVKRYLRAKAEGQVALNEGKLILVGEGEVGKSCLLGALRGDPWDEGRSTTHGIEIKATKVIDPARGTEITLNSWDFGGQRVYRPTHQLFFSSPAVYLVVWKPREGPQQGFVKEWIKLVKHRIPDAKIIVVATHGGPGARQPDIDRQEIWDLFGKATVVDFLHVDSKSGDGIPELLEAIGTVAGSLPEMGRTFPWHWQQVREQLRTSKEAYLPLESFFTICRKYNVEGEDARLLLRICHGVGDLIHYEHDPALRDIVVLKPDWLATAMSYVLDDKETRDAQRGLVTFERLATLWNDPTRPADSRYDASLHPLFVRLMERFDLSYKVSVPEEPEDALGFWHRVRAALFDGGKKPAEPMRYTSLVAQLVPDVRPEKDVARVWPASPASGDEQQVQICRIVETDNNQSATAEGLFFQLIVRLHKFSLGRADFKESVHWQRGLLLADDTGARAFLEHVGNDVRIAVRSPYPQRFLAALTYEVKWLVETFWKGMRCEVTVPCLTILKNGEPCKGLFEVGKLLENKKRGRPEQPCTFCNVWHSIETLLNNAPASSPSPMAELIANSSETLKRLEAIRDQLGTQQTEVIGRFDQVDAQGRETVSKVEAAYTTLMRALLDEAKEGPRLFSFEPMEPGFFDRPKWMSARFKLSLWCEHSRAPIWKVEGKEGAGVYTIDLPREWLISAAPFLKALSVTLSLVLPVAAAVPKVVLSPDDYKTIEGQLALGKATSESLLKGADKAGEWLAEDDDLEPGAGMAIRADGAVLRQLHAWIKEKDPGFGGLVRVMNKRQEFMWVHPQFEKEY